MDTNKQTRFRNASIALLVVVGIIVVLGLAAWAGQRAAEPNASALDNLAAAVANLTSRFFPADRSAELTFTNAAEAQSGEAFTLEWEQNVEPAVETYTFSYECREGVRFDKPGATSGDRTIPCDTPFAFTSTTNTLTLIPYADTSDASVVPVVLALGDDEQSARAETSLTIVGGGGASRAEGTPTSTTDSPSPATAPTAGAPRTETQVIGGAAPAVGTSDPLGTPDLAVRILATGVIDFATGLFTLKSPVRSDEKAAVRFEVSNVGTKASGEWTLRAVLPTSPSHVFIPRENQQSLNPGERIEYTLSFDRVRRVDSAGTVTIGIDPYRELSEVTRSNNDAEVTFVIERAN